jgi:hypothetical protein
MIIYYANTRIILEYVNLFRELIIPELLFWNNSTIAHSGIIP